MRHSKEQILKATFRAITEFQNQWKSPHKRAPKTTMGRMLFHYEDFAIWVFRKKRGYRKGDVAMKIMKMIWDYPHEIGFRIDMGRTDRIYFFDFKATDPHYTKKLLWEGIER